MPPLTLGQLAACFLAALTVPAAIGVIAAAIHGWYAGRR